jgi:predicted metal-dependent hydrolase
MPGIEYRIRPSTRARRVRVRVDDGGVEVVIPERVYRRGTALAERQAAEAVGQLAPWIERRLAEREASAAAVAARGDTVPYLGIDLRLEVEPARTRALRRGGVLHVPSGAEQRPALERWYRRAARGEVAERLDAACARTGTPYTRLTIRGQRTRWASCSHSGAMSFNWRLLLAPEPVLEYVVWHEVCHLQVMDHSARFWALLGAHLPGYPEPRRWLRRHGATLVL